MPLTPSKLIIPASMGKEGAEIPVSNTELKSSIFLRIATIEECADELSDLCR